MTKATWARQTARLLGIGELSFTTTRVGQTLHIPCARGHIVDITLTPGMHPNAISKKMLNAGWTFGNHLLCPDHPQGRKKTRPQPETEESTDMPAIPPPLPKGDSTQASSDAAKRAHRLVMMALEDYYDEKAKAYKPGWSDAKIATDTGASAAHVKQTRESYFGPLGEPPELTKIKQEVTEASRKVDHVLRELRAEVDALRAKVVRICNANGWPVE